MSNDNQKPPQKTGWTKVTKSEYVEQMLPLYKKHRHSNKGSWTVAKKTQPNENVTQQTIIGSKAQKTMNDLQQKLKSVMPAIHEAKQFALTIDTETIRAEREGRTEFSGELTVFGNPIHKLIQTIETNSKAVRENTEKKDFTKAMECIEICELSAAQVLGYQSEWERLLKRFQQTPPERLLGESPDQAQIDFERLLEREREAIEQVIPQTITECKVLMESQYKVKDQFESCLDLQQLKDFPNALQRLQSTIQNVRQFSVLQLGWDGFAAQRRKRERLYQQLQKTPTRDRRAEGIKKEALGLWNVANSEADRAEFETAIQNLEKMEELACLVVSGGGVAALSYDQDYANVMPVVEQALSIKCPCETIRKEQEELTSLRDEFLSAASNHDYSSADYSMGIASSKASHIIELAQRWEACDRSRESQRRLLEVAISMNPGNRSDLQQQVQAKCDQGNANLDNALFKEALEEYSEAHRLAISLLSQAGPQHMSEYYQDLEQYSDLFRQAESVKPIYGPVSKPKKEFIDAKSKMESSEKMADYSGALQMHGIALTRAFDVVKNGELQTLYERDRLAFRPRFEACRKLDRKLPGVEEGLRQLTIALQSMQLAAGTDLAKARVLIKDAVKITNRLLAFKDTTDRQNSKHKDLTQIIDSVNKSYLNPGTAQQYEKQGPGDGDQKLFGDYIQALRESEINRRDPQTFEASLNLLEKAAKAYLDTCPKPYSKPAQNCLATLIQVRQLRLVKEFDQIGAPPWNMLQESRASSLQAKIVFEQGYVKGEAEASTQGVNGSFWLKNVAWGDTQEGNKLAKQLFFKPGALEDLPLMPKGGAAPREALSFTFAEQLKAQTGLDFQTPETLLISVDQSMLELSGEQWKN